MKIKSDFVTNSSSVSYIVSIYKIKNIDKIQDYLKEEFGKLGDKIFKDCLFDKKKLNETTDFKYWSDDESMPYDDEVKVGEIKEKMSDCEKLLYSDDPLCANVLDTLPKTNDTVEHVYSHSYEGYNR